MPWANKKGVTIKATMEVQALRVEIRAIVIVPPCCVFCRIVINRSP